MQGFFITLEGSEGVGKSTQIAALAEFLRKETSREVLLLREPGGTPLGEKVRTLLKYDEAGREMSARTELLLFAASRAELVDKVIFPALERGVIVLSDRFLDSTTVYQGVARALDNAAVAQINHFATAGLLPHLTLLLDMEAEEGVRRAQGRKGGKDRMEREALAFYQEVRRGYLALASLEPERWEVVAAGGPVEEVTETLKEAVRRRCHGLF